MELLRVPLSHGPKSDQGPFTSFGMQVFKNIVDMF